MAGNLSIMTLLGGSSSLVAGAQTIWAADLCKTPFSVSISGDMNSTAAAPSWGVWVTNDTPGGLITASSSSGAQFATTSTVAFALSSVAWFSSFGATNSSNAMINITTPFRFLTLVGSAGSTAQSVIAEIVQAG